MLANPTPPLAKFPMVWGQNAGSGYIRAIPTGSSPTVGAASLNDGFPPANFQPVSAGGVPPFGQDMNGILNQITSWQQFWQAGGQVTYDSTFQNSIGGYPLGAIIKSPVTAHLWWQNSVDNNMTNPDSGGAGWSVRDFADPTTYGLSITSSGLAGNTGGAGLRLNGNGATTPNKTLRALSGSFDIVNHAYSASIFHLTDAGDVSSIRDLTMSRNLSVTGTGTFTGALTVNNTSTLNGNVNINNGQLTLTNTTPSGAVFKLTGNGATTPSKYISVVGGTLNISNNANGTIAQIDDGGDLFVSGAIYPQNTGSGNDWVMARWSGGSGTPATYRGLIFSNANGVGISYLENPGSAPNAAVGDMVFGSAGPGVVGMELKFGTGDMWLSGSLYVNVKMLTQTFALTRYGGALGTGARGLLFDVNNNWNFAWAESNNDYVWGGGPGHQYNMVLDGSGNLFTHGVLFQSQPILFDESEDYIRGSLDFSKLKPKAFSSKDHTSLGFDYDDLQKLSGLLTSSTEDGNLKGINMMAILAMAVAEIQDLKKRLDAFDGHTAS